MARSMPHSSVPPRSPSLTGSGVDVASTNKLTPACPRQCSCSSSSSLTGVLRVGLRRTFNLGVVSCTSARLRARPSAAPVSRRHALGPPSSAHTHFPSIQTPMQCAGTATRTATRPAAARTRVHAWTEGAQQGPERPVRAEGRSAASGNVVGACPLASPTLLSAAALAT